MTDNADALIVGAGPTGLTAAGELAAAGVRVTLLERHSEVSPLTRAFGVHARTLEVLDARGIADELVAGGARVPRLRLFGGVELDLARLPTRFPFLLVTPQDQVERVLERRAVDRGATVVRGAEVVGLRQDATAVEVTARTADGERSWRASYLVGADGVGSAVRDLVGLPFPGQSVLKSIMLADVRLADPPDDVVAVNAVGDAFAFVAPFGDGWYRIFTWNRRHQVPDDAPLDLEEIRECTRRALGTDFGMHDPRWMSRFHSDERQVPRYRVGRVLLAGDAAHVHSPAGGQGMNTGIQDSMNLGWKLAAVVRGEAGDPLLDSYQSERHPVGRMVLRSSGAIIRLALVRSLPVRTVRNVALETLLRVPPVTDRIAGIISGIGIGYGHGPGEHDPVGARAADVPLADGGWLYEALREGGFVLVVPPGARVDVPPDGRVDVPQDGRAAGPSSVRVATAEADGTGTLVRPDGYVAWAGDVRDGTWREALDRWLPAAGRQPERQP